MSKKIGLLQILPFIAIAGLLVVVVVMRNNQIATQQQLTSIPIPQTGLGAVSTATQEPSDVPEPADVNSIVSLSDGSRMELLGGAELVVSEEAYQGAVGFAVNLIEGEMLLMLPPEGDYWFIVHTPGGFAARLKGCSMAVTYSPEEDAFVVDCINGSCEFVDASGSATALRSGQSLAFSGGTLNAVQIVDEARLGAAFSSGYNQCAPLIPVTGGRRTVTATPEPPTATPRLDLTATQACADFHQQFPSTPCP